MNKLGINLWNWALGLSDACCGLPTKAAKMGFTALELPMTQPTISPTLRDEVRASGLEVSLCAAMGAGRDLSSFDADVRTSTMQYLTDCLQTGATLGAVVLAGPLYAGGGKRHTLRLGIRRSEREDYRRRLKELGLGLEDRLTTKVGTLSGGQRQRVAIGRAIVRNPAVFLMDEPLSNLDAKLRNQMRAEIIKLRERIDTTFIYVTHDQTEAMTLGDRIVIMKDGFIQQLGTPQAVFDHPANLFVAGFIGVPQMNFFDARLSRRDGKYTVTVGSVTVELSPEKQQRLAAHNVAEQDVTLGVRPDHIMLCADGVKGTVDVSEMMGSSVHLHVTAEGKDVIVIVPTNGAAAHFPMGSEVNMIFGGNVAHVFDKTTGKNLEW